MSTVLFTDLPLSKSLLAAVAGEGYATATPIQARAIPVLLAGRDLLGSAQTGTGKTAAFALPMLQRLAESSAPGGRRRVRGLVLAPTRELALQILMSLRTYGRNLPLRHLVIFGGVGQNPQVAALRQGIDILVATPGRLIDLMNQGHVDLGGVEMLVLDEADRMLDMGFIPDIRRIAAKLPERRQTMLFSATMPPSIVSLSRSLLNNPERVEVVPQSTTAERIEQCVYHVEKGNKVSLLAHLVKRDAIERAIVFTRTKHGADRVVKHLARLGLVAAAIHGNKSQNNRQRALDGFRSGRVRLLIATDVAARGIDVDGISHVFNFDVTHEPETYVHRIGRTARAGAGGAAVTFCDRDERANLKAIERLIRQQIEVRRDVPAFAAHAPVEDEAPVRRAKATARPAPARNAAKPTRTAQARATKSTAPRKSAGETWVAASAYGQPTKNRRQPAGPAGTGPGGGATSGRRNAGARSTGKAGFGGGAKPTSKAAKRRARKARQLSA